MGKDIERQSRNKSRCKRPQAGLIASTRLPLGDNNAADRSEASRSPRVIDCAFAFAPGCLPAQADWALLCLLGAQLHQTDGPAHEREREKVWVDRGG